MKLRDNMFRQIKEKDIFNKSLEYAQDYISHSQEKNVFPTEAALENLSVFEEDFPDDYTTADSIIDTLHRYGSPATVSQIGGRYFGLVNGGIIPVSLAAKVLADFWDQNTPLYVTSPIISKLESVTEKWLVQLLGLPSSTVAGFVSGSSMAILCGLLAARFRILQSQGWNVNEKGLNGAPSIRVVASNQIHATVIKAISILGIGKNNVEWLETDDQGRVVPEKIPPLDKHTILILQAGNVNTGSFDRFDLICDLAVKAGAWVHIDGAFGLWAAATERLKHLTKNIEKANSWSVDGHKTLNTPYDNGIVLCNDKDALVEALQATDSYIIHSDQRDGMLYTPEMSRRARVVELWAALKYLGRKGIDELVFGLHERAVQFSEELAREGFEIHNDVVFNQVLVSCATDELTQTTLSELQKLRICWCGGSVWKYKKVIRISVCSWATTEKDVSLSVGSFVQARQNARKQIPE